MFTASIAPDDLHYSLAIETVFFHYQLFWLRQRFIIKHKTVNQSVNS